MTVTAEKLEQLKRVRDRLRLELAQMDTTIWGGFLQDVKPSHFETLKSYSLRDMPIVMVTADRNQASDCFIDFQDLVLLASMAEVDTGSEPVRRLLMPTDAPAPANEARTGQEGRAFEGFLYNLLTRITPFILVLNWMEANSNIRDAPNDLVLLDATHGGTTFAVTLGDLRELRKTFTNGLS